MYILIVCHRVLYWLYSYFDITGLLYIEYIGRIYFDNSVMSTVPVSIEAYLKIDRVHTLLSLTYCRPIIWTNPKSEQFRFFSDFRVSPSVLKVTPKVPLVIIYDDVINNVMFMVPKGGPVWYLRFCRIKKWPLRYH